MPSTFQRTLARPLAGDGERWRAVLARDATADGSFVYAVRSTRVYCRSSCPARRPRPEQVRFFADGDAARAAGYRPCRRCRPDEGEPAVRQSELVSRICRFIAAAETAPSLRELAQRAGLSASHFHRLFAAYTGVTPRAYFHAVRASRVRSQLRDGLTVTAAAYEAGFNSSSRFYAAAQRVLGMKPGAVRHGGAGEEIRYATAHCDLGTVLAALSERGICAILLGDNKRPLLAELRGLFPNATLHPAGANGGAALRAVVALVDGQPALLGKLPLDIRGTVFQLRVWEMLRKIPAGGVATYAEIASQLGMPRAARAVANACAANRLAVAIPCHRVLRGNGELGGYRWGLQRKRELLRRERGSTPGS